jgi:hypothetical protein
MHPYSRPCNLSDVCSANQVTYAKTPSPTCRSILPHMHKFLPPHAEMPSLACRIPYLHADIPSPTTCRSNCPNMSNTSDPVPSIDIAVDLMCQSLQATAACYATTAQCSMPIRSHTYHYISPDYAIPAWLCQSDHTHVIT